MEDVIIKFGTYSEIGDDAWQIRDKVFCKEQNISEDEERDSCDETAVHIVLYKNNVSVATGRLVKQGDGKCYIGRVATLNEYRGSGYGKLVVTSLAQKAFNEGIPHVYLHAQTHAEEFYEKIGFESYGDIFLEAGIEHVKMVMKKTKQ